MAKKKEAPVQTAKQRSKQGVEVAAARSGSQGGNVAQRCGTRQDRRGKKVEEPEEDIKTKEESPPEINTPESDASTHESDAPGAKPDPEKTED